MPSVTCARALAPIAEAECPFSVQRHPHLPEEEA